IMYGYLLVGVHADGTISTEYKQVTRDSAPAASGPGAEELNDYCYTQNKVAPGRLPSDALKEHCVCGASK
ncbi:MAG: hypothetical protein ACREDR_16585, partial [Blastocatellia bacterium]